MRLTAGLVCLTLLFSLSGCTEIARPSTGSSAVVGESSNIDFGAQQRLSSPEITALNWFPNYQQPILQFEILLARQTQSQDPERLQTLLNLAYLYDAQLYVLFHELLDYLPELARSREIKEQNEWLDLRETQMSDAFVKNQGGDLGSIQASQAFIADTRKRIAVIEERLSIVKIR
ncbi:MULTISPECIES: hypothetical protein [Nitrincola]|uniref:Uncharacterized protein n=1 Tax=Nitrincola nitratireducens TaxID=1229521 RepID=W9UTU9_9GAMM|nr:MULTISPECIES: hypothetical protein [Nitrincola]EXJ10514.1 hypothetical protein D791_02579 [Nitrincola nitratireducens]